MSRRFLLAAACLAVSGCAAPPTHDSPPVRFDLAEGESAALWQTALWRFESNGWLRERLFVPETPAAGAAAAGTEKATVLRNPRAFGREEFLLAYRGITGRLPDRADIVAEPSPVLSGKSLPGAAIEVFEVSPSTGERVGPASYSSVAGRIAARSWPGHVSIAEFHF